LIDILTIGNPLKALIHRLIRPHSFSGLATNICGTFIAFPNSVIIVIYLGTLRVHGLCGQNLSTTYLRSAIQQRTYSYYTTICTAVNVKVIPDPLKIIETKNASVNVFYCGGMLIHANLMSFFFRLIAATKIQKIECGVMLPYQQRLPHFS